MPLPPSLVPPEYAQPRRRRRYLRRLSPPALPPRWGQDVAPPPTPFFVTPNASPPSRQEQEEVDIDAQHLQEEHEPNHQRQRSSRHKCSHQHHHVRSRRRHSHQRVRSSLTDVRRSTTSLSRRPRSSAAIAEPFMVASNDRAEEHQVITYTYRFSERDSDRIYREMLPMPQSCEGAQLMMVQHHQHPLGYPNNNYYLYNQIAAPPPALAESGSWADSESLVAAPPFCLNSQSPSPLYTTATGSSPDTSVHPTSPVSPSNSSESATVVSSRMIHSAVSVRSALRVGGNPRGPAKSVQWMSDVKKRPEDISWDRKVVKSQVYRNKRK